MPSERNAETGRSVSSHKLKAPEPLDPLCRIYEQTFDNQFTQRYRCLVIPDFDDDGYLPPGIHPATFDEISQRLGWNGRRRGLLEGLTRGCDAIWLAGGGSVWVDGSFVTEKPLPGDFDACWDHRLAALATLDPILQDFTNDRARQKAKYGGEFFPNIREGQTSLLFVEFFQLRKDGGGRKGIIQINPGGLP